jgi:hypothetical protein
MRLKEIENSEHVIPKKLISHKNSREFHKGDLVEISILEDASFSKYDFIGFVEDFDKEEGKIYLKSFDYGKSSREKRTRVHFGYEESFKINFIKDFNIIKPTDNLNAKTYSIHQTSVYYDYNHPDFPNTKEKVFHWVS